MWVGRAWKCHFQHVGCHKNRRVAMHFAGTAMTGMSGSGFLVVGMSARGGDHVRMIRRFAAQYIRVRKPPASKCESNRDDGDDPADCVGAFVEMH